MGVSADEKFRRTCHQAADNRRVVLARIPADMLDQHFRSVHREAVHLREHLPYFLPVYVAVNRPQGTESRQLLGYFYRTDISGMPDFVARFKIFEIFFVPISVGIGQ